jgi:replication factor C subunit 1
MWTTKFAPRNVGEIIGNTNFVRDIMEWLRDWNDVIIKGRKKDVKFNANKSKDNWATSNVNARAILVSGPPGIGKTTAIRLIAKTMGYELIEQNASDVRNKNAVFNTLHHLTDNNLIGRDRGHINKVVLLCWNNFRNL